MTIGEKLTIFNGLKIEVFSKEKGITDPVGTAYKLMLNYDEAEEKLKIIDKFKDFINAPNVEQVQALIIGSWEDVFETSPDELFELMINHADKLQSLKALFVGEMTYDECEISWIIQTKYNRLIDVFGNLELLQIRGTTDLSLGTINHNNLKTLIIESGGLPSEIIQDIIKSKLLKLEHLELWLGTEDYGFDGNLETLKPLFDNNLFPKLTYLGMRNSEIVDEITEYLSNHSILDQLEVLDLSLGTMTDKGAKALLSGTKVKNLKKLDLHHHYISDGLISEFDQLGINVDISEQQDEEKYDDDDEIYRYVYVSE